MGLDETVKDFTEKPGLRDAANKLIEKVTRLPSVDQVKLLSKFNSYVVESME